jgi:hypothetical protein
LPADLPLVLNFWSFNTNPSFYGKNSVLISTGNGNPAAGEFVEIWTTSTVSNGWVETTIDLTQYGGQLAFVAFRYEGTAAHGWHLDDIEIKTNFYTSPIITVSATSFDADVVTGFEAKKHLFINNSGFENLEFSMDISYSGTSQGWLIPEFITGSLQKDSTLKNVLLFNAAELQPGEYNATVTINNNDPENPAISVDISLSVTEQKTVQFKHLAGEYLNPADISTNGEFAVLRFYQSHQGYFYSDQTGLTMVEGLDARPRVVTDDGIVVGSFDNPDILFNGNPVQTAGKWNPATGEWSFLGMNPAVPNIVASTYSQGDGASADGLTIAGLQYYTGSSYKAFRYTPEGYDMIGTLHDNNSRAVAVSKNGSTIGGWVRTDLIPRKPAVWKNGQLQVLNEDGGEVRGVSPDGVYATGEAAGMAFVWSEETGMQYFENTINEMPLFALAVTNEGLVLGVYGPNVPIDMRRAYVRYLDGTMLTFNEYAKSRGLANADDWVFYSVNTATPDGKIIAGAGLSPANETTTFMLNFEASIPQMILTPENLAVTLDLGATASQELTISNPGTATLEFETFLNFSPANRNVIVEVPEGEKNQIIDVDIQSVETNSNALPEIESRDSFILNYDGPNASSIGLSAGGTFYTAVRFPAEMITPFTGASIASVDVYINQLPTNSTLIIWGPGTTTSPGTIIYQQPFVPVGPSWNTVSLTTPYILDGNDVWVGFLHVQDAGLFPAGVDGNVADINGNFLSNNGTDWSRLSDFGLAGNWNIRALLELGQGSWLNLDPAMGNVEPGTTGTINIAYDATGLTNGNYSANIIFLSNDPGLPFTYVPVSMEVVGEPCFPDPRNLSSTVSGQDVTLNWQAPELNSINAVNPVKPVEGSPVAYVFGEAAETTSIGGVALILPEGSKNMSGSTSRSMLYDNGPFINSPGTGPNGTDQSILQNTKRWV